jgi:hypothetical protein
MNLPFSELSRKLRVEMKYYCSPRTPSASGSRVPPCPILTTSRPCLPVVLRFGVFTCPCWSLDASTNSRELATSTLMSFMTDIDVGPEGLMTPKSADNGKGGWAAFGMGDNDAQTARRTLAQVARLAKIGEKRKKRLGPVLRFAANSCAVGHRSRVSAQRRRLCTYVLMHVHTSPPCTRPYPRCY